MASTLIKVQKCRSEIVFEHNDAKPVEREEVYMEKRPVNEEVRNMNAVTHTYEQDGKIPIPVTVEQVGVPKKDAVTGEIVVGKRKVTDTIRHEEADIQGATKTSWMIRYIVRNAGIKIIGKCRGSLYRFRLPFAVIGGHLSGSLDCNMKRCL